MLLWIALSLLIVLVLSLNVPRKIWAYYCVCKLVKPIPGLPIPDHWLYGSMRNFKHTEESLVTNIRHVRKLNTSIYKAWIGPVNVMIGVVDPKVIQQLLSVPKSGGVYGILKPWLGEGLLIAGGSKWARNRRLLTKAFHFNILKPYVAVYNECSNILVSKWSRAASQGEPVLVYKSIKQLTLDIILRCSFSYNSHCQEDGKPEPYIDVVSTIVKATTDRFYSSPLFDFNFLYYLTPQAWKYQAAVNMAHRYAEKVIRDRKQSLGITGSNGNSIEAFKPEGRQYLDFLDILLTACDEDGTGLTDIEIRNEVDTFLFEGHDTTANGITWTLYCLAKYPEHQEKCREEINQVMEGREELEYEDLSKLNYTTWCIKETLRLYPPVFSVFRKLTESTKLGGYTVPKGAWIVFVLLDIHRNPKYWDNPDTFDPLRFHPDNVKARHPYAYMPFSAGPRNCIGQNFALNEERVVIASIIRKFRLTLVEGHKVEMEPSILLTVKNDVKVYLEKI